MINENWEPIPGHEGKYEVNKDGVIRSLFHRYGPRKKEKLLKGSKNVDGYLIVGLYFGEGIQRKIGVHRAVALAFIPNPENKPEVNHKDGDKSNNKVSNLEWATWEEQMQHSARVLNNKHGNFKKGGEKGNALGVLKFDLHGKFLKKYDFQKEAAIEMDIPNSSFSKKIKANVIINNNVFVYEKNYINQCGISF